MRKNLTQIKKGSLKVLALISCFLIMNCASNKSILLKSGLGFEFQPNGFQLATTGNGIINVYSNKLEVQISQGNIRINPRYTRFKTSSVYAIQIGLSRYTPGQKGFNHIKRSEKLKINKILESRNDYYDISNLKFTIPNIKKEDLKNSRITLTIYRDNTYSRTNYSHSNEENTISTLFDF